jgi:dihydroorotate dehydrogenase
MELLQSALKCRDIVCAGRENGLPPLFVKIAPDLTDDELRDIADVALRSNVDGVIVCNTTNKR